MLCTTNIITVYASKNPCAFKTGKERILGLFINIENDNKDIHLAYSPAYSQLVPKINLNNDGPNRIITPNGIIPTIIKAIVALAIKRVIFSFLFAASVIWG